MNREQLLNHVPAALTVGGVVAGLAGFADTMAARNGGDLGLRNALPEPFDIADHGMSWMAGVVSAQFHYSLGTRKAHDANYPTVADPKAEPAARREGVTHWRRQIAGAVAGGIAAASTYMILGEVGSEVLHFLADRSQTAGTIGAEAPLELGHFDLIDILYGVVPAVALTKLSARRANRQLDVVEASLPVPKPAKTKTTKSTPRANKRYTPPKNHS